MSEKSNKSRTLVLGILIGGVLIFTVQYLLDNYVVRIVHKNELDMCFEYRIDL